MQASTPETPENTAPRPTVAHNIRLARQFLNLSQGDLARRLDRDRRQISKWERGTVTPGTENLAELSRALGRHIEWFLQDHPDGA